MANNYPGFSDRVEACLLSLPLTLAVVVLSIVGAGAYLPLLDLDEGAFSEATREMLASGNWVSTYLNGEPRHDKPILIYWLQALSVKAFGLHPFALRLPSMLATCVWFFVSYRFVRDFYNERAARLTLWVMACSWLATVIFKAAIADALLNCLLALVFLGIYRYFLAPSRGRLCTLGIYMGLGFLAKGPVAVGLPILVSLFALLWAGRGQQWLQAVVSPCAWLPFLVVILPWHIAVYLDQGWGFFQGFYLGHNLGRFSSTMEDHGGSLWYYLLLLPLIVAPFTRQFFVALLAVRPQTMTLLDTFLWLWFGLVLVIFSFSQTQLPHYLLYGLTPVFMIIATRLAQSGSEERQQKKPMLNRLDLFIALAAMLLFVLLPFIILALQDQVANVYEQATIALFAELFAQFFFWPTWVLLVLGAVIMVIRLTYLSKVLGLALVLMLAVNFTLLPPLALAQQQPVRAAAQFIKAHHPQTPVVSFLVSMPSFSVYLQRIVTDKPPAAGDIVFLRKDKIPALLAGRGDAAATLLFEQGGIVLYRYH
ncbi:MAG: glycosyltransferase family 39 protein [Cellvibrionaceae bacterium]|nr:glycosyltransferase family 39 protein [Cellvibrionaceae bacterium]